jgi:hypothetical protein
MRVFNEHAETMTKLKGKGGQQRVVVEHVNVAAGGQAIVGAVIRGGGVPRDQRADEAHGIRDELSHRPRAKPRLAAERQRAR